MLECEVAACERASLPAEQKTHANLSAASALAVDSPQFSQIWVDHWMPFLFNTDSRSERHFQNVVQSIVRRSRMDASEAIAAVNVCLHGQTIRADHRLVRDCPDQLGVRVTQWASRLLLPGIGGAVMLPNAFSSVAICLYCAEWKPQYASECAVCGYGPSADEMRCARQFCGSALQMSQNPVVATAQLFSLRENYLNVLSSSR